MSQDKNWVQQPKSEGGGEGGDYNPTWAPQEMPVIEGVLTGSKGNVGKYGKTVYDLKVDEGVTYSVWGTTVLDKQMATIPVNSYIKIEYLGKVAGKGNPYHDFNVFIAGEQAPAPAAAATPAPVAEAPAAAPEPVAAAPAPAVDAPQPATTNTEEQQDDLPF